MVNEEVVRQEMGRRIVAIRKSRGITQEELARRLGVGRCGLSHWERGFRTPSLTQIIQLGAALDAGLDELVLGHTPGSGFPVEQYQRLAQHIQMALEILKVEQKRRRAARSSPPGAAPRGVEIPTPIPARG
jgi:transcriptional regulator with XRE-family HTH domain